MSSADSICGEPSWRVPFAYRVFAIPGLHSQWEMSGCQGRGESHSAHEPHSALQHSPAKHKPSLSITQDEAATVPILADLNRELKQPGNRKDESMSFSEKLMALEIEASQFPEGGEEGTSRFSLPMAVLIAVQWVLQSATLWPV